MIILVVLLLLLCLGALYNPNNAVETSTKGTAWLVAECAGDNEPRHVVTLWEHCTQNKAFVGTEGLVCSPYSGMCDAITASSSMLLTICWKMCVTAASLLRVDALLTLQCPVLRSTPRRRQKSL